MIVSLMIMISVTVSCLESRSRAKEPGGKAGLDAAPHRQPGQCVGRRVGGAEISGDFVCTFQLVINETIYQIRSA